MHIVSGSVTIVARHHRTATAELLLAIPTSDIHMTTGALQFPYVTQLCYHYSNISETVMKLGSE